MPIPINYRKSSESSIASYDYFDIAEGTGIVIFYLYNSYSIGRLDRNILTSSVMEVVVTSTSATLVLAATHNFDSLVFNLPKSITGTALLSLSSGLDGVNTGAGRQGYAVVTLQKISNAIITDIGTCTTIDYGANAGEQTYVYEMPLTNTHLAKGDQLRLRFQIYMKARTSDNAAVKWFYGEDPLNRDGTYLTPSTDANTFTNSKLHIPFKLDL